MEGGREMREGTRKGGSGGMRKNEEEEKGR